MLGLMRPSRGFTTIELMVALGITAILAAVATPSFISLVDRNILAARTNAVYASIQTVRDLALRTGNPHRLILSQDTGALQINQLGDATVLHDSGALDGVTINLPAQIVINGDGDVTTPANMARLTITRSATREFCLFPTGVLMRAVPDQNDPYCPET